MPGFTAGRNSPRFPARGNRIPVASFSRQENDEEIDMSRIARLTLVGFTLALAACNTVSGVGADLKTGGQALSDTAEDAQTQMQTK